MKAKNVHCSKNVVVLVFRWDRKPGRPFKTRFLYFELPELELGCLVWITGAGHA
jgi:hypothetical protein